MAKKTRTEKFEIPAEMVAAVDLFDKDPLEIAKDKAALKAIVEYLRWQRKNIKAAEELGKRISEKEANTEQESPPDNPLELLGKDKND